MSENKKYVTVKTITEGVYKEKGSKFLAFAIPCSTEYDAKEILKSYWKLHPNAVHICFAWRFGTGQFKDRYSDDGEPSGSAGKPIFGQIIASGVTNILVLVVRYYGGTNLGVGGLMRAYKEASHEALSKIERLEIIEKSNYMIFFEFEITGMIMNLIDKFNCEILNQNYLNNGTEITLEIPTQNSTIFEKEISKNNQIVIKRIGS